MAPPSIETPVLIVAHRRLSKVRRVVEACIASGVRNATVVIDGPRHDDEVGALDAVEAFVLDAPWPGSLKVHRRRLNLGVGASVPAACDLIFVRHAEAIILEDDCVPTQQFFEYASLTLRHFAEDRRVGLISGVSLAGEIPATKPIRISRFPLTWGWGTWRDRWVHYRHSLTDWRKSLSVRHLASELGPLAAFDWARIFNEHSGEHPKAWDHQVTFMLWALRASAVNPSIDLVENIGFDSDASNTSNKPPYAPVIPSERTRQEWLSSLDVMLSRGDAPMSDLSYEAWISRHIFSPRPLDRLASYLKRVPDLLKSSGS
jgi:hypothetical protein